MSRIDGLFPDAPPPGALPRGRHHQKVGRAPILWRGLVLDAVWGMDFLADSNVVDRHIRNLRLKLKNGWRRPRYIATVPGQGYRFVPTTAGDEDLLALS